MIHLPESLGSALVRWAHAQPDAPFVTDAAIGRMLSYGAALGGVLDLLRLVGPARRTIVLALPGGIPAALVWVAALTGGHRLVLCSPESTDAERARLSDRYHPDVVLIDRPEVARSFGVADGHALTVGRMEELLPAYPSSGDGRVNLDETLLASDEGEVCLTTSGTTGTPKGVTLKAQQIAWTANQVRLSHHLTRSDRGLTVLPFSHINAPVVSLSATLLAGSSVVIAPRFSLSHFWDTVEREQVTWASVVPTIVSLLLQTERPAWLPGHLRSVRTASAPLPAGLLRAFENRFGLPLIETYGLSEAGSQVAANPVPPGRHVPGSAGLPTGVEMRICEPAPAQSATDLRDVSPGDEGEICIAGPAVIAGYDEGESPDSFVRGWFRTGDLGYRDPAGFLFITGRLRDVINRGGEKISPREVEEVLLAHPMVRDAVVVGEADPVYGQRAVAYVVVEQPRAPGLEAILLAYAAEHLARFKVPERLELVEKLPRTPTGKIRRHLVAREDDREQPRRAA